MLRNVILAIGVLSLALPHRVSADEGMWLPMYIKRLNYTNMQKMGLNLTAEEIYNVNQSSLKDAIVVLNGGSCTAEMVSGSGLLLTNHHCAFGVIQEQSSVEHDYLTDGFWAMKRGEELPAKGMTAGFLVRMEDVTDKVLANVKDDMSESERDAAIQEAITALEKEAKGDSHYDIRIRNFFEGNEFYLFVFETFRDVRLVGAPPSAIGKFGGDTDNWMWPRQTGDFAMLRVYAGKDGKPADYSEDNVPYTGKHHLPVSLKGVQKNDYAMIMGYPGSTDRYLTSPGVKLEIEQRQPSIVKIREKRLALMKEDMNASDEVRIKYASKYARVSNYYKYFIGQTKGLKRLRVYDKKQQEENEFQAWVKKDPNRTKKYGEAIKLVTEGYATMADYQMVQVYLNEAVVFGPEIMLLAWRASRLERVLGQENAPALTLDQTINGLKDRAKGHFKDYNAPTDKKVFAALIQMYYEDIPKEQHAEVLTNVHKKFKGDYEKYAEYVFNKSVFADEEKLNAFLVKPSAKGLQKDPAYALLSGILAKYRAEIRPKLGEVFANIAKGNRLYVAGLREMNPDKQYYPNANSTLRLTYGQVLDYYPRDAVYYNYFTTLQGVMEKEDPGNDEFVVPAKLKTLYENKDYGRYGEDGQMKVCFITNNDITGGNSGSPVINGDGELIGIAFDGNWEAMSGDIAFEHKLQRTIVVDIRYVLFVIDKYAGAKHLVDEMTLVLPTKPKAEAGTAQPEEGTN